MQGNIPVLIWKKFTGLVKNPYLIPFFASFALVSIYIVPLHSLVDVSGDAKSIWQTIITFRSENISSSYVLYKGFLAVYPYIWLYEFGLFLNFDQFLLIKFYHALLFAFVAAVGVPAIVSRLMSVKIKLYKNIVFVVVLFFVVKHTHIFSALMVDLPSWAFFVAAIYILTMQSFESVLINLLFLCFAGLFVGFTFCSSGQYAPSGFALIVYALISIYKKYAYLTAGVAIIVFAIGVGAPKLYDFYFQKTIVQPMRDRGEWIPTSQQWVVNGMTRMMPVYKAGVSGTISNNRGLAILKQYNGYKFYERYEIIKKGGGEHSVAEYINMVMLNLFDFVVMWTTKVFIAISFDGGKEKILHLLVSYTSLFVCSVLLSRKCVYVKDIISANTLIVTSIALTISAPVFLFVEMRYASCIEGFIIGFALHQDVLWERDVSRNKSSVDFRKIPYIAIVYMLFLLLCFSLYGVLLELSGSDPEKILFMWW